MLLLGVISNAISSTSTDYCVYDTDDDWPCIVYHSLFNHIHDCLKPTLLLLVVIYDSMDMTDETIDVGLDYDVVLDDEQTFDAEDDVTVYDRSVIDADDLYDIRRNAELLNQPNMAARIEVERMNCLENESYNPKFGTHELFDIAIVLLAAKQHHIRRGQTVESERVSEISQSFLTNYDFDGAGTPDDFADEFDSVVMEGEQ